MTLIEAVSQTLREEFGRTDDTPMPKWQADRAAGTVLARLAELGYEVRPVAPSITVSNVVNVPTETLVSPIPSGWWFR